MTLACFLSISNYDFVNELIDTMFDIDKNMKLILYPPVIVINLCIVAMLFFGFLMILRYRKILKKSQVAYGLSLFPINGILFIAQSFFPNFQVEMFVLAITCYLAFATIQTFKNIIGGLRTRFILRSMSNIICLTLSIRT